MFVLSKVE